MFAPNEYLMAWLSYLTGVVILVGCFWYITAGIRSVDLRYVLRVLVATLLLTPWYVDQQASTLAPAWLMAGFEALTGGIDNFWRAGLPLVVSLALVVSLSTLFFIARWFLLRRAIKVASTTE